MPAKTYRRTIFVMAGIGIVILVLDAKTALYGAQQGIKLCILTIVPTLFPYIFLTGTLNKMLTGKSIPFIRFLGKICAIPKGGESILFLGLIGGYPIGAQLIADTYTYGGIDRRTAHRMLGFCSNAGPAFIIGMLSPLFTKQAIPFVIWGIHILSAIFVGILLPDRTNGPRISQVVSSQNNRPLMERSLISVGKICGWVILFRILLTILSNILPETIPAPLFTLISGLLELSNGCFALSTVDNEALRMILCAPLLAFGGLCVAVQTHSVTGSLGLGMYIPGKVLQALISLVLILPCSYVFYHFENFSVTVLVLLVTIAFVVFTIIFANKQKKSSVSENDDV